MVLLQGKGGAGAELQERVVSAGSRVRPLCSCVLLRVSIAVIRPMTKSNLRKKGFLSVYTSTSQSIIEEIQGRTLREDSK